MELDDARKAKEAKERRKMLYVRQLTTEATPAAKRILAGVVAGPTFVDGLAVIHDSIVAGDEETVRNLVQHGSRFGFLELTTTCDDCMTPVVFAASIGNLAIVKALLDLGAERVAEKPYKSVNEMAVHAGHNVHLLRFLSAAQPQCGKVGVTKELLNAVFSNNRVKRMSAGKLLAEWTAFDCQHGQTDAVSMEALTNTAPQDGEANGPGSTAPRKEANAPTKEADGPLPSIYRSTSAFYNAFRFSFTNTQCVADGTGRFGFGRPGEGNTGSASAEHYDGEACIVALLLQPGNRETLLATLARHLAQGDVEEALDLLAIVENCLGTRRGRCELCAQHVACVRKPGELCGDAESRRLLLCILLSCLSERMESRCQHSAIRSLRSLLLSDEAEALNFPSLFCANKMAFKAMLNLTVNAYAANVRLGLLRFLARLLDFMSEAVRDEFIRSESVLQLMQSSFDNYATDSAIQEVTHAVVVQFVKDVSIATRLLQQGLFSKTLVLCRSTSEMARTQATALFSQVCQLIPSIVWTLLITRHHESQQEEGTETALCNGSNPARDLSAYPGDTYLEAFLDMIRKSHRKDMQANLLIAVMAAAGGDSSREFLVIRLLGSHVWVAMLRSRNVYQRVIALQIVNQLVRFGSPELRSPIQERDCISSLLAFIEPLPDDNGKRPGLRVEDSEEVVAEPETDEDFHRMLAEVLASPRADCQMVRTTSAVQRLASERIPFECRNLAMLALGAACLDPGMKQREDVQMQALAQVTALRAMGQICNGEWMRGEISAAVYALACLSYKNSHVRTALEGCLHRPLETLAAAVAESEFDNHADYLSFEDIITAMEALSISFHALTGSKVMAHVRTCFDALAKRGPAYSWDRLVATLTEQGKSDNMGLCRLLYSSTVLQPTLAGYEGTTGNSADALLCMVDMMRGVGTPVPIQLLLCRCVADLLVVRAGIREALVLAGVMAPLLQMLRSPCHVIVEQAARLIATLTASDATARRQLVNACRLDARLFETLSQNYSGQLHPSTLTMWKDMLSSSLPVPNPNLATLAHGWSGRQHGTRAVGKSGRGNESCDTSSSVEADAGQTLLVTPLQLHLGLEDAVPRPWQPSSPPPRHCEFITAVPQLRRANFTARDASLEDS